MRKLVVSFISLALFGCSVSSSNHIRLIDVDNSDRDSLIILVGAEADIYEDLISKGFHPRLVGFVCDGGGVRIPLALSPIEGGVRPKQELINQVEKREYTYEVKFDKSENPILKLDQAKDGRKIELCLQAVGRSMLFRSYSNKLVINLQSGS